MPEGADTTIMDDDHTRKADTKNMPKNTVDTMITDIIKKISRLSERFF